MPPAAEPLTEERIEERARIIWEVDDQSCQRCGRHVDSDDADDPRWFIDSEAGEKDASGEPVQLAIIFCPDCWEGGLECASNS